LAQLQRKFLPAATSEETGSDLRAETSLAYSRGKAKEYREALRKLYERINGREQSWLYLYIEIMNIQHGID
jgi:hypothetical protein